MDKETLRKIEETVIEILKKSNLEEMTEYKVRVSASEQLGIDLSLTECKWLVRSVVENFLLSTVEDEDKGKEAGGNAPGEAKVADPETTPKKEVNNDGSRFSWQLSENRGVAIHDFKGKTLVSIRQYYEKDGKLLPGCIGISLSTEQWSTFRRSIPAIEEAISRMTKKLRSEQDAKETDDVRSPTSDETAQKLPIESVRFDGKNYNAWAHWMKGLLQRLKIAYVLSDPCPNAAPGPVSGTEDTALSRVTEQKWMNDDYMCRHNILSSLSDSLFHQYMKKTTSAKELWEELKLLYLFEEFGTKRTQVKQYVEFMIVEEKPIMEQIQELNNIADSIVAAGMWIDENFHVSVIISKLPPSWKDIYMNLMREEHLPFRVLMDRLRTEEESRSGHNSGPFGTSFNPIGRHSMINHTSNMGDFKPFSSQLRNREQQTDGKAVVMCHTCGKKGHISRNCRSKKMNNEATR